MTIQDILSKGREELKAAHVRDADTDAVLLFEAVSRMNRGMQYAHYPDPADPEEVSRYFSYIELRKQRIPLQRILNEQEFMGFSFEVNFPGEPFAGALIPRQETELLAEKAVAFLRTRPEARILDMCTGTGCIPISILKLSGEKVTGIASDISEQVLTLTERNREKAAIGADRLQLVQSDLFRNIAPERFDLITVNPPYVPTADLDSLEEEVRKYDPTLALDGGEDGMDLYRRLIPESANYLKKGGMLLLEIGYDQGEQAEKLLKDAGFSEIAIEKDLAGLDRIAGGIVPGM